MLEDACWLMVLCKLLITQLMILETNWKLLLNPLSQRLITKNKEYKENMWHINTLCDCSETLALFGVPLRPRTPSLSHQASDFFRSALPWAMFARLCCVLRMKNPANQLGLIGKQYIQLFIRFWRSWALGGCLRFLPSISTLPSDSCIPSSHTSSSARSPSACQGFTTFSSQHPHLLLLVFALQTWNC